MEDQVTIANNMNTPAAMIMAAVTGNADLDKVEKLLGLQERWEANEARKLFASSFSKAQKEISSVVKTRINSQTHSKYAELGDVIESSKPVYTAEGFSVIFYEGDTSIPENIRIYADVLHCAGHKETYHYDVPLDGKGLRGNENMTKIHAKASSISYGRRYLMCMIWNIPTSDDDGNKATTKNNITDKQVHTLRDLLIVKEMKESDLIKFLKIDCIEELQDKRYMEAMQAINSFIKPIK